MPGGRTYGSAIAPVTLLAAVVLGIALFVSLLGTHGNAIRIEVSNPALVLHPPTLCRAPCYMVNVTNLGGTAGNVMCQVQPPAVFVSGGGGNEYVGVAPLQPEETWVVYLRIDTEQIPAPPPVVRCFPL